MRFRRDRSYSREMRAISMKRRATGSRPGIGDLAVIFPALALAVLLTTAKAQDSTAPQPEPAPSQPAEVQTTNQGQPPLSITLDEAIHRAEANEPGFASTSAESKAAAIDRYVAKTALLPNAVYNNQFLYTQPNGELLPGTAGGQKEQAPIFIANNTVHEYISQLSATETVGVAGYAAVRRADAAAARAAAELEIGRRGLVAAVSGLFYGSIAADNKLSVARRALREAADFTKLTQEREEARESAHADVLKAQLEQQQRQRELEDAQLAAEKARLELGVLLFPDPRTPYTLASGNPLPSLPTREQAEQAAANNNPELKSALSAVKESNADVLAARAAYLPDLGLNVSYGIDAPQFAVNGPAPVSNLGYSASVTLDVPVWDWLATQHKVKQSEIRRQAAQVALTATQRQLIARFDEAYHEAATARDQLESLDSSVQTAAESLRLTKLRYTGGEATVLEVVDAQAAYVAAANAREDGMVRFQAARADLQTLTGTM
jgi:outer membrane protein TolC